MSYELLYRKEGENQGITITFGTGKLIKAAFYFGAAKTIIGIGGSAANDGRIGIAQALVICLVDPSACMEQNAYFVLKCYAYSGKILVD